jgi:hypothetical protein
MKVARHWPAVAALFMLAGCGPETQVAALFNGGEPVIDDRVWMLTSAPPPADYVPKACSFAVDETSALAASSAQINLCTEAMKQLIDVRWAHLEDVLIGAVNSGHFALDIASLGATLAGPLVPSVATKNILSTIASGFNSTKSLLDTDVLYSKSIEIILLQMKQDRSCWANVIETQVKANSYKNMYQAANDLYAYNRAGSFTGALVSMQTNTGVQANANQVALQNTKTGATASTGASTPSTTTCAPTANPGNPKANIVVSTIGAGQVTMSFATANDPLVVIANAQTDLTQATALMTNLKAMTSNPSATAAVTTLQTAQTALKQAITTASAPASGAQTLSKAYYDALVTLQAASSQAAANTAQRDLAQAQFNNTWAMQPLLTAQSKFDAVVKNINQIIASASQPASGP